MKKTLLLSFALSLYALNVSPYLFSVNMDYKEYENSYVIDGDSSDFGELNGAGVGIESEIEPLTFYFNAEIAVGSSTYDGQTQSGDKLILKNDNVLLFNGEAYAGFNNFYLGVGYREWHRGYNEDYAGDYKEVYYWPYFSLMYKNRLDFSKTHLFLNLSYRYAFNPKLDVYLGDGCTIDLGDVYGYRAGVKLGYDLSNNIMLTLGYRYQYWHINRSDYFPLVDGSRVYYIYEPESKTKNQFLTFGVELKY